jgi:hypothetical protein
MKYDIALRDAFVEGQFSYERLRTSLLQDWLDEYQKMYKRPIDASVFKMGSFHYLYDMHQSPDEDIDKSVREDARLVAVIGRSTLPLEKRSRHDVRMRGLSFALTKGKPGPWDRGHYIGHAIGGIVDGNEANVFPQLRYSNRGRYRSLESECAERPGTLCFSRPIYRDGTLLPSAVEFGLLRHTGEWLVEIIPNEA